MELWDTDFVDMLEPAYITFEAKGGGEFVFGAVRGDLGNPARSCGCSLRRMPTAARF